MRRATRWARLTAAMAVVLAAAATTARADDDKKVEGDLAKMQGTWVRAGDDGPDHKWVIEGANLKASVNGQDYTCTIKVDAKATPHATADIAIKDGPNDTSGKTVKAIYKFEGELLVLCITHPGGEERPTDFKTVEDKQSEVRLKKE